MKYNFSILRKPFRVHNDTKGPVKLIKRVKIAHSFSQSVSNQFRVSHFKLAYAILQMAVKSFRDPLLKMEI